MPTSPVSYTIYPFLSRCVTVVGARIGGEKRGEEGRGSALDMQRGEERGGEGIVGHRRATQDRMCTCTVITVDPTIRRKGTKVRQHDETCKMINVNTQRQKKSRQTSCQKFLSEFPLSPNEGRCQVQITKQEQTLFNDLRRRIQKGKKTS